MGGAGGFGGAGGGGNRGGGGGGGYSGRGGSANSGEIGRGGGGGGSFNAGEDPVNTPAANDLDGLVRICFDPLSLFADGFEAGDATNWGGFRRSSRDR